MRCRIVCRVVSAPVRITISWQFDRLDHLIRRSADGDDTTVRQVDPDFVRIGNIDGFFGHCCKAFGLVYYLARTEVDNQKTLRGFSGNE